MKHVLVAAAVKEGDLVKVPMPSGEVVEMLIDHIEYATPKPGKSTWRDAKGLEVIIGGNVKIEVLEFEHDRD